jgi:hypothetical protein
VVIRTSTKALIAKVLLERELVGYFHRVNQRSVAAALLASAARSDHPVTFRRKFHNVTTAGTSAKFAMRKCAIAAEWIRRKTEVVLNNIREETCHNLQLSFESFVEDLSSNLEWLV